MASESLCYHCNRIFTLEYDPDLTDLTYERDDSYPDLPNFATTSLGGCSACGLLRSGLQWKLEQLKLHTKSNYAEWDKTISVKKIIVVLENEVLNDKLAEDKNGPCRFHLQFVIPILGNRLERVAFDIYADEGNISARYGKIRRRLPDPDPLCKHNLEIIQQLISECKNGHANCTLLKQGELPSRLIDVQIDNDAETRLILSTKLPGSTHYAALSHVWGNVLMDGPFLTTTKATTDARMSGIDLSDMPLNFRDAVKVTRALGLRYIWIDSLCIIQDSFADWQYESQKMAQVYANAYITIVATSAASAHEGFLTRPGTSFPPTKIPYSTAEHGPGFFYLSPRYTHWLANDHDEFVEGSNWNSRGWTFQERLLSTRLLHFTKPMLYYECRQLEWMEDNRPPASIVSRTPWLGPEHGGVSARNVINDMRPKLSEHETTTEIIYRAWYELVERYSFRYLTKPEDKLPAIAGLAYQMGRLVEDQYLLGLWKNDLSRGLLWRTVDWGETKVAQTWRAPSWSWASYEGMVLHGNFATSEPHRRCFELLDGGVVETLENNELQTPSSTFLRLKGRLQGVLRVTLARGDRGEASPHDVFDEMGYVGLGSLDDKKSSREGTDLRALLVLHNSGRDHKSGTVDMESLLLEATGRTSNEYRRVGTIRIIWRMGSEKLTGRGNFFDHSVVHTIEII